MNKKIVICLIIIYLTPLASASANDNVWVAKYSGFIGSNQSISFENYLIKSKTIDDTKAAVTVYKNQALADAGELKINELKKYDDTGVTLLGRRGDYSWISISKLENREVWKLLARTQLRWGEKYSIENYNVDIDTFGADSVNLMVSNSSLTEKIAFPTGGFKDFGNLRIAVVDINRTGFVGLEFYTNRVPAINAEVVTDKDEYFPDEPVQVTVKTTSDAVQNVVGVVLESPQAELLPDIFTAAGVSGTRSFQSKITRLPANSTVTIRARIETRDYYNNAYMTTVSKDVSITPEVAIIKRAPAYTDDENVPVQLYIYNSAADNKSIHVHDTIPGELTARELDWDITLGPKNSTTLTYHVAPRIPGLYLLPAATAKWDGRSASSKTARMTMHMPSISMTKEAVKNGSLTDVKLIISNTGDRPAQVKALDKIPEGSSIAFGNMDWSGKLDAGESATITYSLEGDMETLPAADATYRDIRGVTRKTQSNIFNKAKGINIEKNEKIHTPVSGAYEIMSFMISSFIAMAGIIAAAALIAYVLVRRK